MSILIRAPVFVRCWPLGCGWPAAAFFTLTTARADLLPVLARNRPMKPLWAGLMEVVLSLLALPASVWPSREPG